MNKSDQQFDLTRRLLMAASMVALVSGSNLAYAQETTEAEQTEDEDMYQDTVVVKGVFQQSVIDRIPITPEELPFTLSVLGEEDLDTLNYARPIDALANLPNVTIFSDLFNVGTPLILTRGNFSPVLVDNRNQNFARGAGAQDNSFVERYEALKGPASISVGAVDPGGIFNTVTKSPEVDAFYGFDVRADQFGSVGGEFDLNFGSTFGSDKLLTRVSGAARTFKYDAEQTKRDSMAIRPVVSFELTESTFAKVSASYVKIETNPNKGFPVMFDGSIPDGIDTDTFTGLENGNAVAETVGVSGEVIHEFLDNLKLTVRASHQVADFDYQNTVGLYNYWYYDALPGGEYIYYGIPNDHPAPFAYTYQYAGDTEEDNTFLDVQLAAFTEMWGERQDFVIGLTHNDSTYYRQWMQLPSPSPRPNFGPIYVPLDDLDTPRYGVDPSEFTVPALRNDDNTKFNAAFAEAAIRPTSWLTILAGIRYDDVKTEFWWGGVAEDDATTARLGATVALNEASNVYVSLAQSFVPQLQQDTEGNQLSPSTADGWEIGTKGELFDGSLSYSAAYYNTLRDNVAARLPGIGAAFTTVGEQRSSGIELSATWVPTDALKIGVNYGNIDMDMEDAGNGGITEFSIPNNTFTAFGTYEFQEGPLAGLVIGGGPRWVDEKPSNVNGSTSVPAVTYPEITLVDLMASYPINDTYSVSLNVHNATDELYRESTGTYFGRQSGSHVLGAPRTVSFTVRATY